MLLVLLPGGKQLKCIETKAPRTSAGGIPVLVASSFRSLVFYSTSALGSGTGGKQGQGQQRVCTSVNSDFPGCLPLPPSPPYTHITKLSVMHRGLHRMGILGTEKGYGGVQHKTEVQRLEHGGSVGSS